MAKLLVDNYNSGIVDPNKLIDNQISFRLNHSNSLIKQSGEKMRDIINKNNYKSAPYMGQDDPGEDISAGLEIINNLYSAAMGQKA